MRRPATAALVALVAVAGLTGCGEREDVGDEVRDAVRRTRRDANEFIYSDLRDDEQLRVVGLVEDDFRFKAQVAIGNRPAFEEVVADDALAVRFLDAASVDRLVDTARTGSADVSTELEGVSAIEALESGRWVLDPSGAPPVTAALQTDGRIGIDPVFDAVTALDYVERSMREAVAVTEWDADDLSPAYPASEDSFPAPEDGSGVTRYDLVRPRLPAASAGGAGGGESGVPATRHFRKMAIYVKDGKIVRVLERIEVIGKFLEDFIRYNRLVLEDIDAPEEVIDQFEAAVASGLGGDEAALGAALLQGLNQGLEAFGQEPVLIREMNLDLEPADDIDITLPNADVVRGSLDVLVASAEARAPAEAEEDETSDVAEGTPADGTAPAGTDPVTGEQHPAGATSPTGGSVPAPGGQPAPAGGSPPGG